MLGVGQEFSPIKNIMEEQTQEQPQEQVEESSDEPKTEEDETKEPEGVSGIW